MGGFVVIAYGVSPAREVIGYAVRAEIVTSTLPGSVGANCAEKEKVSPDSKMVPGRTANGTTKASISSPPRVSIGPPLGPPFMP